MVIKTLLSSTDPITEQEDGCNLDEENVPHIIKNCTLDTTTPCDCQAGLASCDYCKNTKGKDLTNDQTVAHNTQGFKILTLQ